MASIRSTSIRSTIGTVALALLAGAALAGESSLRLEVQDGRLSLEASAVPVDQVLKQLGRTAVMTILVEPALEPQLAQRSLTLTVDGISIEDALRRILRGQNLVFVYSGAALAEVRVYSSGSVTASTSLKRLTEPRPGGDRDGRPEEAARNARWQSDEWRQLPPLLPERDEAAARAAEEAAVQSALDTLQREEDPNKLEQALSVLEGEESVPIDRLLVLARGTGRSDVRSQALQLAAEHGQDNAEVVALLRALASGDPSEDVRDTARILLRERGK